MTNVNFMHGMKENLPSSAPDGSLLFTKDSGEIYRGNGDTLPLTLMSGVYSGYIDLADLQLKNPQLTGKIYVTNDRKAYIYSNSKYVELTGGGFYGIYGSMDELPEDPPDGSFHLADGVVYKYDASTQVYIEQYSLKGESGKSAYQIATDEGFVGTESEWLLSLKGKDGKDGLNGEKGEKGDKGDKGEGLNIKGTVADEMLLPTDPTPSDGDIYIVNGVLFVYDSASSSYINQGSIKGDKGDKGDKGEDGLNGFDGKDGDKGDKGDNGLTAYEIALVNGFSGTVQAWLETLKGLDGVNGEKGEKGEKGEQGIQGIQGEQGVQGEQGIKGDTGDSFTITKSYPTVAELLADFNNPDLPEGAFVIVSSDSPDTDEDNAKVFIKNSTEFKYITTMRGLKGEKGDQGVQGVKGDQGEQGVQGVRGEKGDKGDDGNSIRVRGIIESGQEYDLPTDPSKFKNGDAYWVGTRLYIWTDDPLLVSEAGWYRGNDLKGATGVKGDKGDKGDVGDALSVIPFDSPMADYPEGYSSKAVANSATPSTELTAYLNLLNSLIGTQLTTNYVKFYEETFRGGSNAYQKINVFNNAQGNVYKIFEITRANESNGWSSWKVNPVEILGDGVPTLSSIRGVKYRDRLTDRVYVNQTSNLTSTSSNGWVEVNPSKDYLMARVGQSLTLTGRIAFPMTAIATSKGVSYDVTNDSFTLTGGKTYRITLSATLGFAESTGYINVGLALVGTTALINGDYSTISNRTGSAHENTGGTFDIIVSPTTTGSYFLRMPAVVGAPTARANASRLIIQEI